jgi:hypothetical protein
VWDSSATTDAERFANIFHEEAIDWFEAATFHRIAAPSFARELEQRWNDTRELARRRRSRACSWDLSPRVEVGWEWLFELLTHPGLGLSIHWPGDDCAVGQCAA